MLGQLHKMMGSGKNPSGGKQADEDEMDEVVLIASKNDPKPDPESLEQSPMLDELIQHEPMPNVPKPKPQEVDIGKELLDKFFPQDDE